MTFLNVITVLIFAIPAVTFLLAFKSFFVGGTKALGLRLIKYVGLINIAFHFFYFARYPFQFSFFTWIGFMLFLSATALFVSCLKSVPKKTLYLAYSKKSPKKLQKKGPYSFIRHPIYTSYSLCWVGTCFVSLNPISFVFTIALISLYVKSAFQEEKTLTKNFEKSYVTYKKTTGMFLPKVM